MPRTDSGNEGLSGGKKQAGGRFLCRRNGLRIQITSLGEEGHLSGKVVGWAVKQPTLPVAWERRGSENAVRARKT